MGWIWRVVDQNSEDVLSPQRLTKQYHQDYEVFSYSFIDYLVTNISRSRLLALKL
ncbi:hypothetical protein [Tenacibaculum sp. SG-28]|uniref:hypothetical protein n=1 Tax=Tenacibaculum sp. SG-28 TaxID=754426 RepID=UPI001E308D6A|nr:hypothetical protein [Tenacibaculum sp. SG-28]